ncbi:MAG: OOP family OmpA-OmpF porin, partial [Myxococcota bacterium]
FEVSAGLDFMLWRTANDRDGDGIPDDRDDCPDVAGVESAKGCPDRDGDGIKDSADACPDKAGPVATQGCPDRDNDGIKDSADRCPDNKGPQKYKGCPDRDGDTVVDIDDECPDVPGLVALAGCPDKDKDGITDAKDKCPDHAGPAKNQGCPDRDGDGVIDPKDKCPDEPGIVELDGCQPKEVKEMFSGALEGIYFASGSAKIRKKSDKVLNKALAVLDKYKQIKLKVEGHTDSQGNDAKNLMLSKARAASVKQWFVDKGLDSNRLVTNGFGEEKPVGDNKTKKGRAQNRRIEFHVVK